MLGLGLTVHLRIKKHWISVSVAPRRGEAVQVEGLARVAIHHLRNGKYEAVGIGEQAISYAGMPDVTLHDAFCHPRVLIGGFDDAEIVVREFFRRACRGSKPLLSFRMIIEPMDELEGGLTDVEERALQELGLQIGASNAVVTQKLPQSENRRAIPLAKDFP